MTEVDRLLAGEIMTICRFGKSLAETEVHGEGAIPTLRVRTLQRDDARMVEVEREAIDWQLTFPKLTREAGFWGRLEGP